MSMTLRQIVFIFTYFRIESFVNSYSELSQFLHPFEGFKFFLYFFMNEIKKKFSFNIRMSAPSLFRYRPLYFFAKMKIAHAVNAFLCIK